MENHFALDFSWPLPYHIILCGIVLNEPPGRSNQNMLFSVTMWSLLTVATYLLRASVRRWRCYEFRNRSL